MAVERAVSLITTVAGGLNTDTPPWLLKGAFTDLKNIRLRMGSIEASPEARSLVNVPLAAGQTLERIFLASVTNYPRNLWAVTSDRKLYRINILAASPAATQVDAGVVLNAVPDTYAVMDGWLIFGSTGRLQKTDGVDIFNLDITAPTAPTHAEKGVGLLSGSYYYKVSYVGQAPAGMSGEGAESPLSVASAVRTVTDKEVTVTAPVSSDTQVTKRKIWRVGGTLTSYSLVGTIDNNDSGTSTFDDNMSDALAATALLADEGRTQFPTGGTLVRTLKNRLFMAGFTANPTRVYFSAPGAAHATHDVTTSDVEGGWLEVSKGDGEIISAINEVGTLVVFVKENSLHALFGDQPSTFEIRFMGAIGATSPFHTVSMPQAMICRFQDNFWMFNGREMQNMTERRIETFVRDASNQFDELAVKKMYGAAYNQETQEYAFIMDDLPSPQDTEGRQILIWDAAVNAFHRMTTEEETVSMSGSIDATASTAVVGVGTLFTTELRVGDRIHLQSETRRVSAIADNTHLTVDIAFTDIAIDTTPYRTRGFIPSHAASGLDKIYLSGTNGDVYQLLQDSGIPNPDWKVQVPDIHGMDNAFRLNAVNITGTIDQESTLVVTFEQYGSTVTHTHTIPALVGQYYTRMPDKTYGRKLSIKLIAGDGLWNTYEVGANMQLEGIDVFVTDMRKVYA